MMRPGPAGALLAARGLAAPFPPAPAVALAQPEGGGDRNAIPLYAFPNAKVVHHFLPDMPLRGSSLRSLAVDPNVHAIETTMDDLARASGEDPVAFRLRHLDNARARAVIETAADKFGWDRRAKLPPGGGYGFAFAQYKNLEAYCAVALELSVERETGKVQIARVNAAVDTGEVVNPDGVHGSDRRRNHTIRELDLVRARQISSHPDHLRRLVRISDHALRQCAAGDRRPHRQPAR